MFKKFAMLLAPFMLAPLGSLLTPAIARADHSYWITKKCDFGGGNSTPWAVKIEVSGRDNAAHVTQLQFGNGGNKVKIRQAQLWENKKLNGVEKTIYATSAYTFYPAILTWNTSINDATWINTAGDRYVTLWLYSENGKTCKKKVDFNRV